MIARQITDMTTWLLDNENRVFRFLVYKRMFTPYEQQQCFSDESQFEDTHYRLALIEEAVELSPGQWLLGFREICDGEILDRVEYYTLNDIQLSYFDIDQDVLSGDSQ